MRPDTLVPASPTTGARPADRLAAARPAWAWFLAVAVLGTGVYLLMPLGLPQDALYVAFGLAAVVAVEVGVRRNRPARTAPWRLLALGTLLWVTGDVLGSVYADVLDVEAFPMPADAAYLLGYGVVAAGLLLLIRGRGSRRDRASLLDSAVLTAALGVLGWVLLARPTIGGYGDSPLAAVVAVTYPFADILLVGLLIRLVTTPGGRSRSFRLLVTALALIAVADTLLTVLNLVAWGSTTYLDPLWLLSYAACGAAALDPSMVALTAPGRPEPVRFTRTRLVALAVAALVPPVVLAVQRVLGLPLDVWAVVAGSVAVFGLVVARMKLSLDQIQTANAEREVARLALAHQAAHDSLTGLPNRAQVSFLMRGALSRAQRSGAVVGLLFVDLDGFKQVNDNLGHAAGDEVLVIASQRMQDCVRTGDVVARFGGDEFVVLLEPLDEEASAVAVAARLVAALSEPLVVTGGREVGIGASVGVAVAQDGAVDPERLLMEADVAVYRAKTGGRGRVEVFDASLRRELDQRQRLQAGLVRAIAAGDLELRHEPVVDLRTHRLSGYEAKVSWPRVDEDELGRAAILPVAERTELVCDLDSWALREAVRQAACIPLASSPDMLAVPLSGRHLRRPRVLEDVAAALRTGELEPRRLVLVVEAADLADDLAVIGHLERLRATGVRVCLEGFGAHEGPTDAWSRLPVDLVRIDPEALPGGPLRASLLRLTVETAHTFGWQVVGTGISDPEQLAVLAQVGCEYAQGPMPRRTIQAFAGSSAAHNQRATAGGGTGRDQR